MLDSITPVILTYNEAPNIERTLSALSWARRIIVLDSFSDDETETICRRFDNVHFTQREFDQHATQWNAAIAQQIDTEWTLALDADHVVSSALIATLSKLKPARETQGYWIPFIYKINGQALRGSLYPPLVSLYRSGRGIYMQDGHTQRVEVPGQLDKLSAHIYHDDRKAVSRWRQSQKKYAAQEAHKLATAPFKQLKLQDKFRYLGIAPLIVLPYTLFVKGVVIDGATGVQYAWQRFMAELYLQQARLTLLYKKTD
ncbi:glycosyltransferase family 2 protein [Arenicella xantha]|uniref:Glycosyl transferase family 2 n=1 Tax=Arenicella xantha TaxID=644221 RepID=A0A395JS48_9GAMM|nr:glycosyltransferase family 2 protein [Arenicella xantha]RBP51520.1 glycosyl transferase family 2 [Arenicella xantha]